MLFRTKKIINVEYVTGTIKDDILLTIGMIGEIDYKHFSDNAPYNSNFLRQQIKKLSDQGIILKTQVDLKDRKAKTLRLSVPTGYQELASYSNELKYHIDLLERSGDLNGKYIHLYKGNAMYREKRYLRAEGLLRIKEFCDIDFIKVSTGLNYRQSWATNSNKVNEDSYSVFNEDGTVKIIDEILDHLSYSDDNVVHFLTTKVLLKRAREESGYFLKEINRTASVGAFIKGSRILACYYGPSIGKGWRHEVEASFLSHLRDAADHITPSSHNDVDEVYLLKDTSQFKECLLGDGAGKEISKALSTGATCYIVPLDVQFKNILSLILDSETEDELLRAILEDDFDSSRSDYIVGEINRTPVVSFLDCDLRKMLQVRTLYKNRDLQLIIHSWQEGIVRELYPDVTDPIILAETALTDFIYSEEEDEDEIDF